MHPWLKTPILAGVMRTWLTDRGSLTQRLQQTYRSIRVIPLKMRIEKGWIDELRLLNMPTRQHALMREVILCNQETPLVFAHSIIPRRSMRGPWLGLRRLGNKPLGAVLFANPRVRRTALSYKKLHGHDALYRQAKAQLSQHLSHSQALVFPTQLWARRSVFSLNCAKILVTEVFLPIN